MKIKETQYQYDQKRHKRKLRIARQKRELKRLRKGGKMIIAKPGVLPLSILYPTHPGRLYGRNSTQYQERDLEIWQ